MDQTPIVTQFVATAVPPKYYARKLALGLGIAQIVFGVTSIALGAVAIHIRADLANLSTSVWGGLFYLSAGVLGAVSYFKTLNSVLTGCMVMSILSALATVLQLAFHGIGVATDTLFAVDQWKDNHWSTGTTQDIDWEYAGSSQRAVGYMLILLAVLEGIASIWQSALTCMSCTCCCQETTRFQGIAINAYGQPVQTAHAQPTV